MTDDRRYGCMLPLALVAVFWSAAGFLSGGASAQTPNPVTPGYQICSTTDPGNTHCSFQPVDATHGLPVSPLNTGSTPEFVQGTGAAGAPLGGVLSVQGVAGGVAQPVTQSSQFPVAATPISGNAQGSTGAVVGTLAGVAAKTTYVCGFNVSAVGGTAAIGPVTIAGLIGSSQVYQINSAATPVALSQSFSPCIPASAVNTSITITTTADGTATAVDINSWGFQQ